MKVLFIYHNIDTKNIRHFPFGIGVLSAQLKAHGHETELLYIQNDMSETELADHVRTAGPDLIGFSTVTLQWPYTRKFAGMLKRHFSIPIICGGVHATFKTEEVAGDPAIDMACIGEGAESLLDVVTAIQRGDSLKGIPNIWYKDRGGEIHRNGVRPLVENLDMLPFPDRGIMPFQEVIDESKTEPVFITSRGCPYSCRFCSNAAIKSLYKGKGRYVRQRSPENVIREIRDMRRQYEFNTLNFYDEAFGFDHGWVRTFCDFYEPEFGYPFGAFVRAETMDRETLHRLRKAGLSIIYIGVESGNDEIRNKVMGRKVSKDRIIRTCREALDEGIQVWTFNMVGVPGETNDTIRETMELNRMIDPHFVSVSIYQPFPGTPLYEECIRNGYIRKDYATSLYDDSVLELPTISREDLLERFREFQALADEIRIEHEKKGEKIFLVDI